MKNLIYIAILFACFAATPVEAANLANPNEPMIVRSYLSVTGLEISLANLEQTATKVTLSNLDSDKEYFVDVVRKHNGYSWNLKLDQLPEGRYVLAVKKGDTTRKQVVLKTADGVMLSAWK